MRISTALFNQRGLDGLLDNQGRLSELQARIASGQRMLAPSDDPAGASQLIRLTQTRSITEQFLRNADQATNRLAMEEDVLANIGNSLLRLRELTLQANNSFLTNADRAAIGKEVRQRFDEIMGYANSRDANGEFLFAGNRVNDQPFVLQPDGTVAYTGDNGSHLVQIGPGRRVADNDSGSYLFMDIVNGNGRFLTSAGAANAGSGVINPGNVSDQSAYVADTYTISFVTNAGGKLAYNVVGTASGQVIPPPPQDPVLNAPDYSSGAAIQFQGISTGITGAPAAGDQFNIVPSTSQDLFSRIDALASALETPAMDDSDLAQRLNTFSRTLLEIDQVLNRVTEARTSVGARLNTIDDQHAANEDFLVELESTISAVRDLNLTEAIVELQQRAAALEAAQASFVRIQSLSLFEFL